MFTYFRSSSLFWFRVFGYGIAAKDLSVRPLSFSERNGFVKTLNLFGWSFKFLSK